MRIRPARPSERGKLAALMDRSFRLPLAEQIGPFLRGKRIGHHWVTEEDGRLTAALGFYPHEYRLDEVVFSVSAVGQVCTDPDFRGGGRMTLLLDRIRPLADAFDFVWLDGDRLRYGRYGWAPGGVSYRFTFTSRNLPDPPPVSDVVIGDLADFAAEIAAALNAEPQGVRFAPGETVRLFRAGRGRDFCVARLHDTFIVFNKSNNLAVLGHGDEEDIARLLAFRLAARMEGIERPTIEVRCGPESETLLRLCARRCAHYRVQPSNSYRIGSLTRFCRRALRWGQNRVSCGDGRLALRNAENGQSVVLKCRRGRLSVRAARRGEVCRELTTAELSAFFLGLCPPETIVPDYPPDSPFRRVFPLPVHINPLVGL